MSRKVVSVVICTHNPDVRILQKVVDALAAQTLGRTQVEHVLIANACDPAPIQQAIDWKGIDFTIVHEPVSGLTNARRRGVRESCGEYIAFVDDDNILDPDYLAIATGFLDAHPDVGVVGGRSDAVASVPLPFWFSTYAGQYAVGVQEIDSGDVTSGGSVWGAGMVLRAPLIRTIVEHDIPSLVTDRTGAILNSGGDTEICRWYVAAGYRLFYDERLHFLHHMATARLTKEYFKAMNAGHRASWTPLGAYTYAISAPPRFSRHWWLKALKTYARCLVSLGSQIPWEQLESLRAFPFKTLSPEVAQAMENVRRIRTLHAQFVRARG